MSCSGKCRYHGAFGDGHLCGAKLGLQEREVWVVALHSISTEERNRGLFARQDVARGTSNQPAPNTDDGEKREASLAVAYVGRITRRRFGVPSKHDPDEEYSGQHRDCEPKPIDDVAESCCHVVVPSVGDDVVDWPM